MYKMLNFTTGYLNENMFFREANVKTISACTRGRTLTLGKNARRIRIVKIPMIVTRKTIEQSFDKYIRKSFFSVCTLLMTIKMDKAK